MNAVGIDVSKGKSTVAIMRPYGEIVASPFEISHTEEDFKNLTSQIKNLHGESRIIMEYTGRYYEPLANYLYNAGLRVAVVNAILIHDYSNSSIRRVKTDKKDAIKIANYGLDRWLDLPEYMPEEELRQALKVYNRQFTQYAKLKVVLINNLIALSDQTFPGVDGLFGKTPRQDGHQKWIDFIKNYWHKDCITKKSLKSFDTSCLRLYSSHYRADSGLAPVGKRKNTRRQTDGYSYVFLYFISTSLLPDIHPGPHSATIHLHRHENRTLPVNSPPTAHSGLLPDSSLHDVG